MGMRDAAKRVRVQVLAASLMTAATLAPISEAAAAGTGPVAASSGFTAVGELLGVAAVSARNSWAVGFTGSFSGAHASLIVHWDGTAWRRVFSPGSRGGLLIAVAATSAGNAWAVGTAGSKSLILHWTGTMWRRAVSPSLPGGDELIGAAATSARDAWAVGCTGCTPTFTPRTRPVILRWNGSTWKRVPSPVAGGVILDGVAATSASNAWAVGFALDTPSPTSVILHWNGTAWRRVSSPDSRGGLLQGVAATSARDAWAVGFPVGPKSLILHWNGAAWKLVPGLSPLAVLAGVAATSARDAWAVGNIGSFTAAKPKTLVLHWNGSSWK